MTNKVLSLAAAALLIAATACTDRTDTLPQWSLTETLRIGGSDVGPSAFDYLKGLAVDAAGRIFVYDRSTQDIRVFGPDGALLRVIGRKGSGPGELRDAEGIAIAGDGTLWVRDAANARFTTFDASGEFARGWTMQFCTSQGAWDPRVDPAGRLLDEDCMVQDRRAVGYAVLGYHTDLSRVDTIGPVPECGTKALAEEGTWITKLENGMRYQSIPFRAMPLSVLGARGELWCVPNSSKYEIQRLVAGSSDTMRVVREIAPIPVTAQERDSVIAEIESKGPTGLDFGRIPVAKPSIERLSVDDEGRLWVRRATLAGEVAFDIYSADGKALATAVLGKVRTSLWRPFVVARGQVYAVLMGADDVEQVVRFSIGR